MEAARSAAKGAISISAPRSKRCEASVCMPCDFDVRRMDRGSNQALSSSTERVPGEISELVPPMIPASATAAPASAITRLSGESVWSTPSRVVRCSPGWARRTMISLSLSRARSKACNGCPNSINT